ncbi:MAG: chorismate synthase [Clostridia bacterium]|nr:chorismate synthase [Clostridia bacterium]
MSSIWGEKVKISVFGGSHTAAIGVTIDGLPSGEKIDMDKVLLQMSRRAPGKDKTATPRCEKDFPNVICGLKDGFTTGAPLTAIIVNTNTKSSDYGAVPELVRPGHADLTALYKYGEHSDFRGGGHFSGRLTASIVFAGAVCRQILERKGIVIGAHALSIGSVKDISLDSLNPEKALLERLNSEYFSVINPEAKEKMYAEVEKYRMESDSIGGIVECAAINVPKGIGEPMFQSVESVFSSILFSIPAVKGVEFGRGFGVAEMCGSENNDPYRVDDKGNFVTETNNAGGILGGITNGMPIVFRLAFKPTPSIGKEQKTVNTKNRENADYTIHGRHDPCIIPRAIPVVEAAAAIALMNLIK